MFVISEADVSAIRGAFDRGGEFSAALELRWLDAWRISPARAPRNDRQSGISLTHPD
jgi:hypothetical protein